MTLFVAFSGSRCSYVACSGLLGLGLQADSHWGAVLALQLVDGKNGVVSSTKYVFERTGVRGVVSKTHVTLQLRYLSSCKRDG